MVHLRQVGLTAKEDNSTIIYGEKAIIRLEEHPTYPLIVQYTNGEVVNYELGKIQSNDEGGQNQQKHMLLINL